MLRFAFFSPVLALFCMGLYKLPAHKINAIERTKISVAAYAGCSVSDLDKVVYIESRHKCSAVSPSGRYVGLFQFNKFWLKSKGVDLQRIATDVEYNYLVWKWLYLKPSAYGKLTDWKKVRQYQKTPSMYP